MFTNPTLMNVLAIFMIVAVFYFLLLRPQQKRQKERNVLLGSLKKGDKIVTIGGLHGSIVELTEEKVTLKVNDTTRLVFERSAVNALVSSEEDEKLVH